MEGLLLRGLTAGGGGALFLAFLLVSKNQDVETIAFLAVAAALVGFCCGLGALGLDHVFVRVAKVYKGIIYLPTMWTRYLCFGLSVVACIAWAGALLAKLPSSLILLFVIFTATSCLCTSAGSLLRIAGRVIVGALFFHAWKFAVLVIAILLYAGSPKEWFLVASTIFVLVGIFAYRLCAKMVRAEGGAAELLGFLPTFAVSILVISGLGYLDRIFAVRVMSAEDAAVYGLLANIVLGPATTVASAIGFSSIGIFKSSISGKSYSLRAIKAGLECAGIAAFFGGLTLLSRQYFTPLNGLKFSELALIVFLLVSLAGIRGYYAASSAAVSVVGSKVLINKLNVVGGSALLLLLVAFLGFHYELVALIVITGAAWVVRVVSFDYSVKQELYLGEYSKA